MATKTPKPQKLSTVNLLLATVLISLLVLGIGGYVSKSLISKLSQGQKLESKQNQAASILATNLQTAPTLVQSYQSLNQGLRQEISNALPTTPDVPGLLAILDHMASISGVTLNEFSPTASATTTTTATVGTTSPTSTATVAALPQPVAGNLSVEGDYANVITFFHNVELSARPIQLSNFQLSGQSANISGTVSFITYYMAAVNLQLQSGVLK